MKEIIMSDKLQVAATEIKTNAKSKEAPDGGCCTAPPDDDPGPIKP
jgi:hypothetical protein